MAARHFSVAKQPPPPPTTIILLLWRKRNNIALNNTETEAVAGGAMLLCCSASEWTGRMDAWLMAGWLVGWLAGSSLLIDFCTVVGASPRTLSFVVGGEGEEVGLFSWGGHVITPRL